MIVKYKIPVVNGIRIVLTAYTAPLSVGRKKGWSCSVDIDESGA